MTEMQQQVLFDRVRDALGRTAADSRPVVLMTCGIAESGLETDLRLNEAIYVIGSGKSTLANAVVKRLPNFHRLSVDEIINDRQGVYGVDYPADMDLYQKYMDEAGAIFNETFAELLGNRRRDVILDRSFYAREDRDDFRARAEKLGGRVVLVFFRSADKEVSWKRIVERSRREKGANNALEISRELFEMYWDGFEDPSGEGEIVVDVL